MKITEKFCTRPTMFYAMSIAATWAGVGSLINSITMAKEYGLVPFIIWALGNTLACVIFGVFAPFIPKLRDVFRSKPIRIIVGCMCVFQVWLSMNGIQAVFAETILPPKFGMYLAYVLAVVFILLLIRYGMIRNVLTDNASWTAVYGIVFALTVAVIFYPTGNFKPLQLGLDPVNLGVGLHKSLLLLPGPFLYPYFFEILDYNEKNLDGTTKINVQRAFTVGGLLFGTYLAFTLLLAWTHFSPALNILKAVLITLIAVSTLSSFLYSIYITFGRGLGLAVNIASVALWQLLIPLGVMGVWTLMAQIRIWIVAGTIAAAIIWHLADKLKAVQV